MYTPAEISDLLFLDIETAVITPDYNDLPERLRKQWDRRCRRFAQDDPDRAPESWWSEKAAIYAEFSRVVCISCGYIKFAPDSGQAEITLKSFTDQDERVLLEEFGRAADIFVNRPGRRLCAHNGKGFDFPFLGRRYLIQGLQVPYPLQVWDKKPWETPFVDTMELWRFGEFRAFTGLELLATVLDIPTSKDDIDGSEVGRVFWEEGDLDRIARYCEKDVWVTAQVLLRMSRLPLLAEM